jgi:hypothetical protein
MYYGDITWYRIQLQLQIVSKISLH